MPAETPRRLVGLAAAALLCLLILCLHFTPARSHGMMCGPRQRAAYKSDKCKSDLPSPPTPPDSELVTDYCAHCLNGGTVATVKAHLPPGGWKVFEPTKDFKGTADRAGLCGDPKGSNDHMIGGDFMPYDTVPIVDHWKKGGEVDFTVELDTNHNGYFDFFLCDLDSCGTTDIDAKCFTGGHCYKLMRVPHPDCEKKEVNTYYECGPIDPDYPGRWYVPCRNTGHVGVHIVGGPAGTMRYKLPEGVECKHCVVQWYWATANSCAPRGFLAFFETFDEPFGNECESDGGGRGAYRKGMSECGGASVPEEFWSCADVQITSSGKSAGPVKAVGTTGDDDDDDDDEPSDEEEVKEDPEGVLEKAKEELEKDINSTANEESGDKKKDEVAAAKGTCLLEGSPCDGTIDCCDAAMVCVLSYGDVKFSCRYWWSLWQDAEKRAEDMKKSR